MDAPYDATPMHGPRLSLSGPSIAPPRDPYAFNLSDLALHPEFNQPYVSQLHPSHYDVFGPTGPSVANVPHPFPPMGTVGSTSGSALFYQDQAPFSRPIGTISPPRASQMLFSSPRHAAGTIGPPPPSLPPPVGGGLGQDFSTPTSHGYANEHPVSPVRMPHRLSVSANTPTLSRLPLEAAASGSSSSPPRTAQDLLMRVLGTANTPGVGLGSGPGVIGSPVKPPGTIGGGTSGGGGSGGGVRSTRGSTSPPRGGNDRLEDIPPLIFGTMNGQSIWAP
ncbi:hypothetical protein FRC17_005565 [Serendipita sp. 399]|nr:hypothetical protein FRC17_005565 [Serendipita sp. 399]